MQLHEYNDYVLEKLHSVHLGLLQKLDEVCRKYDISYSVMFGTAIGTVRHQGFIPWDDDVDVVMMRDDYEKLKKLSRNDWGEEFSLTDPSDHAEYHHHIFPRLYKMNTIFDTAGDCKCNSNNERIHVPIWLDIFLMDYVESREEIEQKLKKCKKLKQYFLYSCENTPFRANAGIKNAVLSIGKKFLYRFCNVIHKNASVYYYNCYREYVHSDKPGEYITTYDPFRTRTIRSAYMAKKDMAPYERRPFESIEVSLMHNYHEVLTNLYKRFPYMELPPEDKRRTHPPKMIDFGDGTERIEFI